MSYHYAIIDENNKCIGFAPNAPSEIIADNYIPIETPDAVNLWDVWNGETWEEGTPPVPETPEETTDNVTWDSMAAAINEGVNEV